MPDNYILEFQIQVGNVFWRAPKLSKTLHHGLTSQEFVQTAHESISVEHLRKQRLDYMKTEKRKIRPPYWQKLSLFDFLLTYFLKILKYT